ncbi:MAG: polyhydroxybutyrate depolymerase [Thermoleophilaceae bacterium]|nr:polyhydroxybutyrate depolymerase [Thermoleophilaceae bacterium]
MRAVPPAIATIAAAAALLAAAGPSRAAMPPPCSRAAGSGDRQISIRSGGLTRYALVHTAAGTATGARVPVVLVLHGAGGTGARMAKYTGMSAVADRSGFIAVYPSAVVPHPFWNYYADPGRPDDIGFISDLIDHIERTRCVDPHRIYATGVSNGGGMTAFVGCALSSRVAAIAPVAGGYARVPDCRPARPVSVLEIHGTADTTVPYGGRGPGGAGSAPRYVREWVERDRCEDRPVVRKLTKKVTRYDWLRCAPGVRVGRVKVSGGTHEWPGWPATASPPRSGLSASWAVWRFFARLRG